MADEVETPPQGWYEDPEDQTGQTLRFWTGSQWTDQRRQQETETHGPEARSLAIAAEEVHAHPAGWYEDSEDQAGQTLRFWDGSRWTDQRRQQATATHEPEPPSVTIAAEIAKVVVFAIALGFGATGAVSLLGLPVLAFYFPLGFGVAGLALAIVGYTLKGPTPWFAWLAVAASVGAIIQGASGYSEYQDIQDQLDQAQDELRGLP
jgi:hypothetical protein